MGLQRQVLFWLAAGLLALLALLALRDVLLPFIVGLGIAYALNPLVGWLVRIGLPRWIASLVVMVVLVVIVALALVLLVPLLINQAQQLATALPDEIERLRAMIEAWAEQRLGARYGDFLAALDRAAKEWSFDWGAIAGTLARSLWDQGRALAGFVSLLLIAPLVAFYVMLDWIPMLNKIDGWLPRQHAPTIRRLAGEINAAIAAFIRGQGLVCIVLGAIYAIGLNWIGLRYGLLIGVATGIMSFVPFLGWAVGLITALSLAFVQFWPQVTPIALVAGVFAFGQLIDAGFLSPRIVGPKIGLHPVWLILSLFVFSYLFGLVGVLVAVPLAAAVGVLVRFALELYLSSEVYRGATGGDGGVSGAALRSSPGDAEPRN